ncbi:hypothetical protein GCM10009623_36920 [Nocardioides aestuarii]|uniref:Uncharacterized protein n=1 Tax=Nocardioides aestuarii TaxID=252231 RepID=A0ABW4TTC1_9ACTN
MGRGLLGALGGVVAGAVLSLVVWELGFIASITSFVLAAGAVYLYGMLAGAPPRRGLVPLVAMIVLGVVATFFLLVGWDAAAAYDEIVGDTVSPGMTKGEFVTSSLTDSEVLGAYGKDMALFFVFAALGRWTTLKGVISQR